MLDAYDLNPYDFINSVMREMLSIAAQGAAYEKWPDDFSRKEVREVWNDMDAPLRRQRNRRVTIAELQAIPKEDLFKMGFHNWGGEIILIPLWLYNYIADGENLVSIMGKYCCKGTDYIDLDVKGGAIAYGFKTPV